MKTEPNTMENLTKEDLSDAFNAGYNRCYADLNPSERNVPEWEEWFKKFSLYKDHPTTASDSVAAPKPDLETENARLRQAYNHILSSRNDVDEKLNEAKKENERLSAEMRAKNILAKDWGKQLDSLRDQLAEKDELIKDRDEKITELVKEIYRISDRYRVGEDRSF